MAGVTASKDEAQAVIFKRLVHFVISFARARFVFIQQLAFVVTARLFPASIVNQLATGSRCDPGGRVVGHTVGLPAYDGCGKSILHRFFGQIEGM